MTKEECEARLLELSYTQLGSGKSNTIFNMWLWYFKQYKKILKEEAKNG